MSPELHDSMDGIESCILEPNYNFDMPGYPITIILRGMLASSSQFGDLGKPQYCNLS
jgi:hypothetical protein